MSTSTILAILATLNFTSNTKDKVILDLTSSGGVLIKGTKKRMLPLTSLGRLKTIIIKLMGKVMVGSKEYPITLEGETEKVFIGRIPM